jgi:hypothetical protein
MCATLQLSMTKVHSGGLISDDNVNEQHCWLVIEFMLCDGDHLPEPSMGDKVTLVGVGARYEAGWMELDPVWRMIRQGETYTTGLRFGGSRPAEKEQQRCRAPPRRERPSVRRLRSQPA